MELLQLRYFRTVARMEHMTKATQALLIAQPALSKHIEFPVCRRNFQLVWQDKRYLSLAARKFRDFLIGYFAESKDFPSSSSRQVEL